MRHPGTAHRAVQEPRGLLRTDAARGGLHLERHDRHGALAPSDALAGPLRGGRPRRVPHLLRRSGPLEPLRPAAQLPAPQGLIAGLHGRPPDQRLRLGRLLPRRLRGPAARHGRGPEAQDSAGRELRLVGSGRALRTEAPRHGGHGDRRHEGLPRGAAQGGVPPHPLRGLRCRGDPFGVRHGGAHLAGLLRGREPLPLPGLDARCGPRRERPLHTAAGGGTRRAEHHRPGQPVVVRLHPDAGRREGRSQRIVRHRGPHRPCRNPRLHPARTMAPAHRNGHQRRAAATKRAAQYEKPNA